MQSPPISTWTRLRPILTVGLIYFLATKLAVALTELHANASSVWLPSGIAFAALLLHGVRLWPGIALGAFVANLSPAIGVIPAAIMAAGSAAESAVGVLLATRLFGFRPDLARARDVIVLFFPVALGASAISASCGIIALRLAGTVPAGSVFSAWAIWWLGNGVGIAIVSPFILTWYTGNKSVVRLRWHNPRVADAVMVLPCLIALITFVVPPGHDWSDDLLMLSIFPVAVWCVLIARLKAIALANLVITAIAVVATAVGYGPFGGAVEIYNSIIQQGYIYSVSLVTLVLGAGLLEKQVAEQALRESETRFRTMWETTNDATLIIDDDSVVRFANPAVRSMFGYAPEELVGRDLSAIQPEGLKHGHAQGMRHYIETGQRHVDWRGIETRALHRDGHEFPVEIVFSEIPVDGRRGFVGFMRDISKRKEADRELRRSQALFSTVFAASPVAIVFSRLSDGRYFEANQACMDLFGFTREEVIGKTTVELGVWPNLAGRAELIALLQRDGRADRLPIKLRRKNGEEVDVHYSAQLVEYAGEPCIVATIIDVTASKRAEEERMLSEQRFARIFYASPDAIVISRLDDGVYVELNDAWVKLCGYSREELVGKRAIDLGIWANPERRAEMVRQLQQDGRVREFEFQLRRKNGDIAVSLMSAEVIDLHGTKCLLAILIDVTERYRTDRQLRESERRFADVVDAAGEYVWETDRDGHYTYVSARIEKVLGFPPSAVIGKTAYSFMPPEEVERLERWFEERPDADAPIRNLEHISITRDGRRIWQQVSGVPVFDADGTRVGMRGTGLEITERKEAEQRIEELATRDALTQLPNRRLLADRLSQGILSAQRSNGLVAVLFIDLDRFKTINDSLGHTAGDELLRTVAERLQQLMRKGDTLARIGGDEFVVVLEALRAAEDAGAVAQKIISVLSEPYAIAGTTVNCSASVGISVYPGDAPDGSTLVRNADMAMYFAKEHGRRNYQFYSEEMNARAVEKLTMESTLRRAIEREEFELYYHPKFELASGRLVGVEALLRWRHPELGIIGPGSFIPVAEDTGLIVPLGEWVLNRACLQNRDWTHAYRQTIPIAVNLSVGQFSKGLTRTVRDALAAAEIPPEALELEITESMLMSNVEETMDVLRRLSDLGVRIAIDDFGTGYSSLAYLRRFHVDTLKIDQSFVREVENNLDDAAIIEAIVALGHSLQLNVIAEGVENAEQRRLLGELGCDQCQGFLFGEPVPAAQFEERYLRLD